MFTLFCSAADAAQVLSVRNGNVLLYGSTSGTSLRVGGTQDSAKQISLPPNSAFVVSLNALTGACCLYLWSCCSCVLM